MRDLEALLKIAVDQYRQVLDAFDALERPLGQGDHKILRERVEALEICQAEARETDQLLLAKVDGGRMSPHALPLVREYRDLLKVVAERNRDLLNKARVHQALVAAEIAEIKGSKTALAGYRMPTDSRGTVLANRY
jgi:dsDNA-binding SOS-regulon protein